MTTPHDVVFLLDVDNTLLDNDRVMADLRGHLERDFGATSAARYWAIFEELRSEIGQADYLGALQRYRLDAELGQGSDLLLLQMSAFLIDSPFADRLYPRALEVIEHLSSFGPTVILSDGDVVFQPHKVRRSGPWEARPRADLHPQGTDARRDAAPPGAALRDGRRQAAHPRRHEGSHARAPAIVDTATSLAPAPRRS